MFGRSRTTPNDNDTGLGAGWFAAAALIGVVIVALVGVLIVIATRDEPPTIGGAVAAPTTTALPLPTTSTSAETGTPADDDRPEGCSTTGIDQTIPVDTPSDVTWTLNQGLALPSSPVDGPALRGDAGVGYCYGRTPVGAVLAASNIGRGTGTDEELQDAQFRYSIVPGDLASEAAAAPVVPTDPAATAGVQLAGFRVISYTQDSASIALALSDSTTPDAFIVTTLAMQWFEGDWRAVMQPGPSVVATASTTTSLSGYVAWSGVS